MQDTQLTARQLASNIAAMADGTVAFSEAVLIRAREHLEQIVQRARAGTASITAYLEGAPTSGLGDAAVLIYATACTPRMKAECAARNLQRIEELNDGDACPMDEPLLSVLAEFVGEAGAVMAALELAQQAHAALDNTLLHLSGHCTVGDALGRRAVADSLAEALRAVGIEA